MQASVWDRCFMHSGQKGCSVHGSVSMATARATSFGVMARL